MLSCCCHLGPSVPRCRGGVIGGVPEASLLFPFRNSLAFDREDDALEICFTILPGTIPPAGVSPPKLAVSGLLCWIVRGSGGGAFTRWSSQLPLPVASGVTLPVAKDVGFSPAEVGPPEIALSFALTTCAAFTDLGVDPCAELAPSGLLPDLLLLLDCGEPPSPQRPLDDDAIAECCERRRMVEYLFGSSQSEARGFG